MVDGKEGCSRGPLLVDVAHRPGMDWLRPLLKDSRTLEKGRTDTTSGFSVLQCVRLEVESFSGMVRGGFEAVLPCRYPNKWIRC
jgi:hypothetical protein